MACIHGEKYRCGPCDNGLGEYVPLRSKVKLATFVCPEGEFTIGPGGDYETWGACEAATGGNWHYAPGLGHCPVACCKEHEDEKYRYRPIQWNGTSYEKEEMAVYCKCGRARP